MSNEQPPKETMTTQNPFAAYASGMTEMQKAAMEMMSSAGMPQYPGVKDMPANPMAAMVAASAMGMGVATQMVGMMIGAMNGVMKMPPDPSSAYGIANPLSFDTSTGGFDDSEGDPLKEAKPAVPSAAKPTAAEKPAVRKPAAAAPSSAQTEALEKVKEVVTPAATVPELVAVEAMVTAKPVAKTVHAKNAAKKPKTAGARKPAEPRKPHAQAGPIMVEDFVKPKGMKKPVQPDDLKAISGIGPKLEQVLNSLGVWSYRQIAKWKPEEVAWVDDYLQFKGRIERDGWIGQASKLAKAA